MELSTLNRDIAPLASDVHPDLRVKCSPRVYETAGFSVYAWLGRKRKQKGCEICFLGCWKTFIISIFVNALWHIVMLILDLRWSGNICIPCSGFFTRKVGTYIDILGCIWEQLSLLSTKILFRCQYPDVTRFHIWTHPDDRTNVN